MVTAFEISPLREVSGASLGVAGSPEEVRLRGLEGPEKLEEEVCSGSPGVRGRVKRMMPGTLTVGVDRKQSVSVRALDRAPYETCKGESKGFHNVGITALYGFATRNPNGHCARAQKTIIGWLKNDRGACRGGGGGVESVEAGGGARVGAVREYPHVTHAIEVLWKM